MDNANENEKIFRSGFVSLVGRPNVGKSSLVNALLREKAAAVSNKPQTTRQAVRCILTTDDAQIVLVDTPGLHKPRHKLGEFMMREAQSALDGVDVLCFVEEAGAAVSGRTRETAELLAATAIPKVLVLNKVDVLVDKEAIWRTIAPLSEILKPAAVVPVSAKNGTNLDVLTDEVSKLLPPGELIYPEEMLMDATERFLAAEIIREKIFEATEQEVPHSTAVVIEEFKSPDEYPDMRTAHIRADIIVERPGQKGILIGEKGARLKAIGSAARVEMQERFGWPMYLELWVRVRAGWRKSDKEMERAGYSDRDRPR